jgi:molybdate/tungstate transport system substrate-binding protein
MRLQNLKLLIILVPCLFFSCVKHSGTLHIVHAGSLSMPVREAADSFERMNPGIRVLTEAWGSKAGARRVSEMDVPCDIFISADYKVIDLFLIPGHADWNISFAGNEMVVVYNSRSRHAGEIDSGNWHEILLRSDVIYGRSDPDSDPCGARSVLVTRLAEAYYKKPGLSERLLSRHMNMIRPKETDLLALLEINALDYIFLYRSVAQQHGLDYVVLPDKLNLRDPELNHWYAQAQVVQRGSRPGDTIAEKGEAIVYGLTIPHKTKNIRIATEFVQYFLSRDGGLDILEKNWQNTLIPSRSTTWGSIPEDLREFALP